MDVRHFETSVEGRLKKYKVKSSFDPIFEALTNSIHAIEERFDNNLNKGLIEIFFRREPQAQLTLESNTPKISSVIIKDNGIGFNEENFKSFLTIDSLYKTTKGGQGIGRLASLKVFDRVTIESSYQSKEDNNYYFRPFHFLATGVKEEELKDNSEGIIQTKISLEGIKTPYEITEDLDKIALKIIQHFLSYFATQHIPRIIINDDFKNETLIVNDAYQHLFSDKIFHSNFSINNFQFKATSLIGNKLSIKSRISLFAHKRCVTSESLEKYLPIFKTPIFDSNGSEIKIFSFIEGEYLDSNVNDTRNSFILPETEDEQGNLITQIPLTSIYQQASSKIEKELKEILRKAVEANNWNIRNYINEKSPRYKFLLKYKKEEVENIIYTNDADIDLKLRKIEFDLERESIEAANTIVASITEESTSKDISAELYQKVGDLGKSNLAQYVCNRKAVLSILSKALNLQSDNKFTKEEIIHKLIFPLGKTSDELAYEDQNLWILDERLAYHNYLASDVPIKKMNVLKNDSRLEPDITIFKGPIALTDQDAPFNSVVIVEFKRPQRADYTLEDNPIKQVMNYVSKIRSKKAIDRTGRTIDIDQGTRFFCHIICDNNDKLEEIIEHHDFKRTPDPGGFFHFHEKYNAYIEISTYNKVINDALKRNKILFEKLRI